MRNFELANKITAYEALTRHLDQDYTQDMERIQDAQHLAHQVVGDATQEAGQHESTRRSK